MEISKCAVRLGAAAVAAGLSLAGAPGYGVAAADTASDSTAGTIGDAAAATRPARGPARPAAPAGGRGKAPSPQPAAATTVVPAAAVAQTVVSLAAPTLPMADVAVVPPAASVTATAQPLIPAPGGLPAGPAGDFAQGALLLVRRTAAPAAATVTTAAVTSSAAPPYTADPANSFTTIYGTTAAGTVTVNDHTWVADPTTHLYTTTADLAQQWQGYYSLMKAGQGGSLNVIQRLLGNSQAVFENTRLKNLTPAQLSVNRQDVQRSLDAVYAAMIIAGADLNSTLTQPQYLAVQRALQADPTLLELAIQGHGLNNSGIARYAGYTKHFQTGVDGQTRYIGGGLNDNTNALARFFDDNILTHMPFPTVVKGGVLWQLNQNGNRENTVADAVTALNAGMTRTYVSSDFLQPPQLTNKTTNQQARTGKPFSFTLPAETFVDPQGQPMTYTATLPLGAALPSWLTFNAATGQFTGTPPAGQRVSVVVRATNSSGLFTTEGFVIVVR